MRTQGMLIFRKLHQSESFHICFENGSATPSRSSTVRIGSENCCAMSARTCTGGRTTRCASSRRRSTVTWRPPRRACTAPSTTCTPLSRPGYAQPHYTISPSKGRRAVLWEPLCSEQSKLTWEWDQYVQTRGREALRARLEPVCCGVNVLILHVGELRRCADAGGSRQSEPERHVLRRPRHRAAVSHLGPPGRPFSPAQSPR